MKSRNRILGVLSCAVLLSGMLGGLPASAAVTADQKLTYSDANANSHVKVTPGNDGSFEIQMNGGDEVMEQPLKWSVEVDVNKVPYWIVQVQSMPVGKQPALLLSAGGVFVGDMSKQGDVVVDLRPLAKNGVFTGELVLFYQDYQYKRKGTDRSVTKVAQWLSASADLGGKITADNRIASIDIQTLIDTPTELKAADGYTDGWTIKEDVGEYGFDMWVDPDQEIETYSNTGYVYFTKYVDLDKVPYLHVNLSELETSFVFVANVINPEMGTISGGQGSDYVLAGSSGIATYNLKDMVGGGKKYVKLCMVVDDGSRANAAANYIKLIRIDDQEEYEVSAPVESSQPGTESSAQSSDSSQTASGASSGAASSAPQTSSASSESGGGDGGFPVWGIVAIVAGVVVLVGGGVAAYFFLIKKKSSGTTA